MKKNKMTEFSKKKIISSQTLGDRLKRVRRDMGLSLEQVAKKIKINEKYLYFLERGQYNKMPSSIFIKNYLKKYTSFLDLNWQTIVKMYEREMVIYHDKQTQTTSSKFSRKALVIPRLIYAILIIFALLTLTLYLIFEISNFIQPPQLNINNLPDQLTVREHVINIEGKTDANAQVFINGQEVVTDDRGNFKEEISLQKGLNTIEIMAMKKHSKERVIYKQIFVEE